ncbi:MAG: NUDIX domain-containing protein [Acidobacteria bacterium]|nr:NUDIX domain-containing protein [Acidobacteriota bacterium]
MRVIDKPGLLIVRDGRILLCRKRKGTQLLILPGGKREPGEDDETCLRRELAEEIAGVAYGPFTSLGVFEAPAAGEDDALVRIALYQAAIEGEPTPQAEIAELIWFDPHADDRARLSPILRDKILPAIAPS